MPRVSADHLAARRQQILEASWRCFAREGFHATSMHDVIAEAGLSAGAVYRYFRSKEELISAAAETALGHAVAQVEPLLASGHVPSPDEAVLALVEGVEQLAATEGADLSRVGLQTWAEALRNPALATIADRVYRGLRGLFVELAGRWRDAGHLAPDADPEAVGQVLFSLVPGYILQRLLLGDVDPTTYAGGLRAVLRWQETPAGR